MLINNNSKKCSRKRKRKQHASIFNRSIFIFVSHKCRFEIYKHIFVIDYRN